MRLQTVVPCRSWLAPLLLAVAVALGAVSAAPSVFAQEGTASLESNEDQLKRAQDLSRTVMSPFCPGRTLDSCPSPYATKWREDIREMVAQGMSNEEIRKELKTRTDKDLTGAPSTALDPVMPVLVSVLALGLLIVLLRKLVPKKEGPAPSAPSTKPRPKDAVDEPVDEEAAGAKPSKASGADDAQLEARLARELDQLDD